MGEMEELIKSKAYDRLSYADKEDIKLIDVNSSTSLTIEDMIILVKSNNKIQKLDKKALHKYVMAMLEDKFSELGAGFSLMLIECICSARIKDKRISSKR